MLSKSELDVLESLSKGRKKKNGPVQRSYTINPTQFIASGGYYEKQAVGAINFALVKRLPNQLSLLSAIINTRCQQVSSFSQPFRSDKSLGYVVKHKDPAHETSKSELKRIKQIEEFIQNCGVGTKNPRSARKRDSFNTFLKKIVRDSLLYDQCAFEVIPTRAGDPFEFVAVDGSTVRLAVASAEYTSKTQNSSLNQDFLFFDSRSLFNRPKPRDLEDPAYVQLLDGAIAESFTEEELVVGIRNPRTDMEALGYGYSEVEQLVNIITAHLHAEEYNRRFFKQGSAPKGILNFRDELMSGDQLESFRHQWANTLEGVHNSWRTPIMQSEAGIDWIDLEKNNRDMEFSAWMEYLIKITSAVFLIDPAELNFDLHGGVQQTPLFESASEWKLKASRDRGLKPLLKFISRLINDNIVQRMDPRFVFEFVGLDELSAEQKHDMNVEQLSSYRTLNEIRREQDLPDVEYGDAPMNSVYVQFVQMKKQEEQQEKQAAQMQQQPAGAGDAVQGQPAEEEEISPDAGQTFGDSIGKSLTFIF